MLIDEVHTPDSSRFWRMEGEETEHWDKEFMRLWYAAHGYRGDGEPPALPDEVIVETAQRYVGLYEGLTGGTFEPAQTPLAPRIAETLHELYL
jgi:phosphoribosylaminoimidazole-succinocarboxamide synthase